MNRVKETIANALKAFESNNFELFIKELLTFRTEVLKIDPALLDLGLVDLIMDENVWIWAISAISREPTDFDWEAAGFIAADLKDTLLNMDIEMDNVVNG